MRASYFAPFIVAALAPVAGCAGANNVRYVYQDGEYGVVGLPANTDRWPTHYRRQAERLMEAHFPEGHEIVRAEEVVEGSRTLTVQGVNSAELLPQIPGAALQVGRLGVSSSRSRADTLKLKECRIIYHRAPHAARAEEPGARAEEPVLYAQRATLTPAPYVDPNAAERRRVARGEPEPEATADEPKAAGKVKEAAAPRPAVPDPMTEVVGLHGPATGEVKEASSASSARDLGTGGGPAGAGPGPAHQ